VAPFYGRWMRGKVVRFAGNPYWPYGQGRLWRVSLGPLPLVGHFRVCARPRGSKYSQSAGFRCDDGARAGLRRNDGYYEVHKQVCIDSRRSRLLWGSGNARQNRMGTGCEGGTGFPNQDGSDVGVLENRWVTIWKLSESPTASTGRDARCAMPLWWMGGNMGTDRDRSGDGPVWFSTAGRLGTGFAVNPQMRVDCGGGVF
jgi:hypothetical protein